MATKATIYKAFLNIANMDSHYYAERSVEIMRKNKPLLLSFDT